MLPPDRRADQLSGGHQQRVATAPALVNGPAVVLADEPTGAVDSATSAELMTLVRHLNRDEDISFVIVTLDLELAAHTDRSIRLHDGRIVADLRGNERARTGCMSRGTRRDNVR